MAVDLTSQYSFLENTDLIAVIKDTDLCFCSTSNMFAKIIGWNSAGHAIGKSDYNLPSDAHLMANRFQEVDKKVLLSKKKLNTYDIIKYKDSYKVVLGEKMPLFDEQKNIIGLYCHGIDISKMHLNNFIYNLRSSDSRFESSLLKQSCSYILGSDHSPLPLTLKQQECLFFYFRGYPLKLIAHFLGISIRTAQGHIEAIKYRLSCANKPQVIERAIASGFIYHIPSSLAKNLL